MIIRWLLCLVPIWLLAVQVQAQDFTIANYEVVVNFSEKGHADFNEKIEVEFSQPRHGIFRAIPLRSNVNDKPVVRIIDDPAVEGHNFSKSKENNNLVLKIGDADTYVEGRQVYNISYRVLNPFNHYDQHIEFYWDLLGVSWPAETQNFVFTLNFPDNVNLTADDVRAYTGDRGLRGEDVELNVFPHQIKGRGTKTFVPGEALTIAVRLPKDSFKAMSGWRYWFERHGLLLAPILFLLAGFLAKFYARNKRQTIMTEYFPPEGISPAVAGGFVDHSVDSNDVLSLIPHLANHGYLRLEATEEKGFFRNKSNITFHKLKDAGPELMPFEQQFFNALFSYGDVVHLEDLKEKFYSHMASIHASVKNWIHEQGWYEADQKAMGCFTGVVGVIALAWGAYAIFANQNMDGIALVVTAFILFYFANRFNKRTLAGNQTYQKLEGFRQFVAKAEKPVIERLLKDDPMYYDKTMPFALAFGYLSQWNRQFEGLLTQPPSWYTGPMMYGHGGMNSWNTFSESFPSEIDNIGSVFDSAPASSGSGGGGGGGGFSGGGSGGGGGGSW